MYIYVHTFVYVCVCFCNIIEYTRQGSIHACYAYDHVCMHVHALTLSLRAASAPSDTSCATVPARPPSLAQCKAERI